MSAEALRLDMGSGVRLALWRMARFLSKCPPTSQITVYDQCTSCRLSVHVDTSETSQTESADLFSLSEDPFFRDAAQDLSARSAGRRATPSFVSMYSTLGGTSRYTLRLTTPSFSKPRNC